ncbi:MULTISPECIES: mycothione reductase [Actinomadura]|uniref:mycothione reductase n=1 Tax=Actinomadura TaxID=1988 RepID=UPI0003AD5AB2|nr:mycothione reductase [Actinomadura madurae]SPT58344.1 Mycothione reductase [Actinomadura madurae]
MTPTAPEPERFDVAIIGTGSGNSLLTPDHDGLKVAIVERDVFGGTCLNRGCIPTKMFVYAADIAETVRHSSRYGVDARLDTVRWNDIADRVFGRIDPIADGGEDYRKSLDNVTVFNGEARFTGERTLGIRSADGSARHIAADDIVLAAGASPRIPPIPGLAEVPYHTSDTILRIRELPRSLIVLGGGFIAAEMAHIFGGFGVDVTIISRGPLLAREDEDISREFTRQYSDRFTTYLNAGILEAAPGGDGSVRVEASVDGERVSVAAQALLVATGRTPAGEALALNVAGVEVDAAGYVVTDKFLRTTAPGVWALGDIANPAQLKHTANAEARIVAHNLVHPDDLRAIDLWPVPHAVFAGPQIASVGLTEQELRRAGTRAYVTATQHYRDIAYGWAMEDTRNFCKLIADAETRVLLGAHIIGPNASTLIQQLIQGMRFGQTVDEMARGMLYIHPALSELVENALLKL